MAETVGVELSVDLSPTLRDVVNREVEVIAEKQSAYIQAKQRVDKLLWEIALLQHGEDKLKDYQLQYIPTEQRIVLTPDAVS